MDVARTPSNCNKWKEKEEIIEKLLATIFVKINELDNAKQEISRPKKQMNIADPPNCDIAKP